MLPWNGLGYSTVPRADTGHLLSTQTSDRQSDTEQTIRVVAVTNRRHISGHEVTRDYNRRHRRSRQLERINYEHDFTSTCRWSVTSCSYHRVLVDMQHQCWHSCPCRQKLTHRNNNEWREKHKLKTTQRDKTFAKDYVSFCSVKVIDNIWILFITKAIKGADT